MRPLFTYYGSKWRSARRYPEPEHDVIIEPFAGSAGYSTFHAHRKVWLFDTSDLIAKCWEYLLQATPDEILSLPDLKPHVLIKDTPGIPEKAEAFIGAWAAKGDAYQRRQLSAWARKVLAGEYIRHGSSPLVWSARVRQRVASQLRKIKQWKFHRDDYRQAPDIEATWFIDPPYKGRQGSHYPEGSQGFDYDELGTWCKSRRGLVIVCEGPEGDWLPFEKLWDAPARPEARSFRLSQEFVWVRRTTPPPQLRLFPGWETS